MSVNNPEVLASGLKIAVSHPITGEAIVHNENLRTINAALVALDTAEAMLPSVNGVAEASKALVLDSSGNIDFASGTNIEARGDPVFDSNGNIIAAMPMHNGTTSALAAVVLGVGEPGYDTTLREVKIGDGATLFAALNVAYTVPQSMKNRYIVAATITRATTDTGTITFVGYSALDFGIASGQVIGITWGDGNSNAKVTVSVVAGNNLTMTVTEATATLPADAATPIVMVYGGVLEANQTGLMTLTSGGMHWHISTHGRILRHVFTLLSVVVTGDLLTIILQPEAKLTLVYYGSSTLVALVDGASDASVLYIGVTTAVSGGLIGEGLSL